MLYLEIIILCSLFFILCYLSTGTDEKNLKSFDSYPNEVQKLIREIDEYNGKPRALSGALLYNGLFHSQENFHAKLFKPFHTRASVKHLRPRFYRPYLVEKCKTNPTLKNS